MFLFFFSFVRYEYLSAEALEPQLPGLYQLGFLNKNMRDRELQEEGGEEEDLVPKMMTMGILEMQESLGVLPIIPAQKFHG